MNGPASTMASDVQQTRGKLCSKSRSSTPNRTNMLASAHSLSQDVTTEPLFLEPRDVQDQDHLCGKLLSVNESSARRAPMSGAQNLNFEAALCRWTIASRCAAHINYEASFQWTSRVWFSPHERCTWQSLQRRTSAKARIRQRNTANNFARSQRAFASK